MTKINDIDGWIAYLETGLHDSAPWMRDRQSRDDFLVEMIDKGHRRGAIDTATANQLAERFGLTEVWPEPAA